ncbi:hypothetical protein [Micromonospora sp. NPDC126480]|uniref:hypothetical protein n=1 Tax=Micromonospora sp. NPDC126480 TaxID=3155312 RepID=UPI0033262391
MIMAVGRLTARLATVCAVVGALVALNAPPALAEEDSVRVSAAGRFTAGGSAQGVAVEVRKRTEGCVLLRTALALRLDGLRGDQVRVQVNAGGQWFPVALSGGGGGATTAATSPANPRLCKGKRITVRYRVAFAADTREGLLAVVGEATNAVGQVLGRGSDGSRVVGGRASASPTPSRSRTPSPTPSAEVTEAATAEDGTSVEALADPGGGAVDPAAAQSSGGSMIMFFGLAMVAVGIVLIVLLVRRFREDKEAGPGAPPAPGGGTYRSAQGPPPVPGRPGQVYGQPAAGRPATPGLYGTPPAQRPAPGLYGAPVDATQAMPPEATQAMPPEATQALPPEATQAMPPGPPAQSRPAAPPAPPVPGQYGTPAANPPAEDDRTRFMPRQPE